MAEKCLFCQIIAGKVPCKKVYEDEHVFSFMDANPANPGHTLVVPKKHKQWFEELEDEECASLYKVAKKVSTVLRTDPEVSQRFKVTATNIFSFNGKDAGQEVFHYHVHVIPRSKDDKSLKISFPKQIKAPWGKPKELELHFKMLEEHSLLIKSKL